MERMEDVTVRREKNYMYIHNIYIHTYIHTYTYIFHSAIITELLIKNCPDIGDMSYSS